MGGERFGCVIGFEGDDVDGFGGRASYGGYAGWVEGFIARFPFGKDIVVDGEGLLLLRMGLF